jgi:hypothetical protein
MPRVHLLEDYHNVLMGSSIPAGVLMGVWRDEGGREAKRPTPLCGRLLERASMQDAGYRLRTTLHFHTAL